MKNQIQKRKKEIEREFNQISQRIQELILLRERLRGAWAELDKLEKDKEKNGKKVEDRNK